MTHLPVSDHMPNMSLETHANLAVFLIRFFIRTTQFCISLLI